MKKYIIIAFAALTVLSACDKDFLTEAPKKAQSTEITLSSEEGIDAAVAGAYGVLVSPTWYGEDFIINPAMATAEGKRWITTSHISGRYIDSYNIIYSPSRAWGLWSVGYSLIGAANSILENIENVSMDETKKANLKAEALFLRALAHFDLVRVYAHPYGSSETLGVPVITKVQSISDQPERATTDDVYKQIIADLTEAEDLMADDYQRKGVTDPRATATKPAIQALLARAYLYHQEWQKAADYATKVIESGNYEFWTVKEATDAACFTQDVPTGGEIIFETYGISSNTNDGYWDSLQCLTSAEGSYGDAGSSADIPNLYDAGDVRNTWYETDKKGEGLFTRKYAGKGVATPDVNNTVVLRLSEMYLIRAEAVINGATGSSAVSDLKAIADARGAVAEPATKAGVYEERMKELCWEGHLWFDLARTGRDMDREDVSGTVIKHLPAGDYRWAFPIPQREFNVNENLVQNKDYAD